MIILSWRNAGSFIGLNNQCHHIRVMDRMEIDLTESGPLPLIFICTVFFCINQLTTVFKNTVTFAWIMDLLMITISLGLIICLIKLNAIEHCNKTNNSTIPAGCISHYAETANSWIVGSLFVTIGWYIHDKMMIPMEKLMRMSYVGRSLLFITPLVKGFCLLNITVFLYVLVLENASLSDVIHTCMASIVVHFGMYYCYQNLIESTTIAIDPADEVKQVESTAV